MFLLGDPPHSKGIETPSKFVCCLVASMPGYKTAGQPTVALNTLEYHLTMEGLSDTVSCWVAQKNFLTATER